MNLSRLILCCLIAAIVSACAQSPVVPTNSPPLWLNEPALLGHLAVVASAQPQNIGGIEAQRRTALTKARAELAKAVRVHVRDEFRVKQITSNNATTTEAGNSTEIRALEAQRLDRASIRAEWTDPQTNELFFWYVTPLE